MDKKEYILITGASSGIGRMIAIKLSENNNIILHGRNEERLLQVLGDCSPNKTHLVWIFDLSDLLNLENALSILISSNKIGVNAFIHSAGMIKMIPLKMVSEKGLNDIFSVNVFSAHLICKILTQKKTNNIVLKNIVFISSNVSNFGAKAMSSYASTKGALDSLMRCLAVELAPNVRVNSVLPGGIRTEMTESIFINEELVDRITATYPLGLGKTENISDIVDFLISDKASWITGQQFTVDGGRTINISG